MSTAIKNLAVAGSNRADAETAFCTALVEAGKYVIGKGPKAIRLEASTEAPDVKGSSRWNRYGLPTNDNHVHGLELVGRIMRLPYGEGEKTLSNSQVEGIAKTMATTASKPGGNVVAAREAIKGAKTVREAFDKFQLFVAAVNEAVAASKDAAKAEALAEAAAAEAVTVDDLIVALAQASQALKGQDLTKDQRDALATIAKEIVVTAKDAVLV